LFAGWEMLIAAAIGFVGGYSGIAGAPFIVFLLTCLLDYSQHSAQGTVLAMMLGPMTLVPVIYGRHIVKKRWREILICILTYMAFSFAGGEIAYLLTSPELTLLFGVFIAILGVAYILFAVRELRSTPRINEKIPLLSLVFIGALVGTVGGMTGIGAGILLMPLLTMWLRVEYREAQTMSLAILAPPVSLGAVIRYGLIGNDVAWPAWGWMLFGYFITAGLGYKLSLKHDILILKIVLSMLLIAAGGIDIINVIY
jgi:uncharacterized membrane protein YfcA